MFTYFYDLIQSFHLNVISFCLSDPVDSFNDRNGSQTEFHVKRLSSSENMCSSVYCTDTNRKKLVRVSDNPSAAIRQNVFGQTKG